MNVKEFECFTGDIDISGQFVRPECLKVLTVQIDTSSTFEPPLARRSSEHFWVKNPFLLLTAKFRPCCLPTNRGADRNLLKTTKLTDAKSTTTEMQEAKLVEAHVLGLPQSYCTFIV